MCYRLAFVFALVLAPAAFAGELPRPDHVVVVIEENRGFSQIMNAKNAGSYIHSLAARGMLFTRSYGVARPSQPNYLALFSGSTQGVATNDCPQSFTGDNLATALIAKGLSFAIFSESLPAMGSLRCRSGAYERKHNPLSNWQGTRLPPDINLRFSDFRLDPSMLPTVAFVVPDQNNDMHNGSFETADAWLKTHIGPYVEWAYRNNSLLILTWDEDDGREKNRIVTLLVGPMVRQGTSEQRIDHYSVFRTLLDFYGLPAIGDSAGAQPIAGVWKGD